ncbi:MAG: DUF1269 domain-containing protein [Candidatus Competibacter sp.]|nr:DUF1269 domain-containing protein [Candidatus Competibacter sp.]
MSNTFVAIAYDDMFKAQEVRLRLLQMQKEYLIDLEDAVVAVRDDKGKVKLHQIHDLTTAGALSGSFWGLLIGLIFMNPLLGLAAGAAGGALSGALADIGINDDFMKKLASELKPGTSVLFVLVKHFTPDKVLAELEGAGGRLLKTSLSHEDEATLQAVLDAVKPPSTTADTVPNLVKPV